MRKTIIPSLLLFVLLLTACGDSKDSRRSDSPVKRMEQLSMQQLVGNWFRVGNSEIFHFYPDSSVMRREVTPGSPEWLEHYVYSVANTSNGPLLIWTDTNPGSARPTEWPLADIYGCDGYAYSMMMLQTTDIDTRYTPLWNVGNETFEPLTPKELGQTWHIDGNPSDQAIFQFNGRVVIRSDGDTVNSGRWSLGGNNLVITFEDEEPQEMRVVRVSRCQDSPLVILIQDERDYTLLLTHPSVTFDQAGDEPPGLTITYATEEWED